MKTTNAISVLVCVILVFVCSSAQGGDERTVHDANNDYIAPEKTSRMRNGFGGGRRRVFLPVTAGELLPTGSILLPPDLIRFCVLGTDQYDTPLLTCSIGEGEALSFSVIRAWTSAHQSPHSVKITCTGNGKFNAPWPLKADNLNKLEISGCLLTGYFDDIYKREMDNETDSLTHVNIFNNVIEVHIMDVIDYVMNMANSSKSAYCGSQKLVISAFRNNTYSFPRPPPDFNLSDLKKVSDKLKDSSNKQPFSCAFDDLQVLDESMRSSRSKYSFDMLVSSSTFPKLVNYNISYNQLVEVPDKLIQWSSAFPSLTTLDMSNNNIKHIRFSPFVNPDSRKKPLVIDLRDNKVKSFPAKMSSLANNEPAVIFDLRSNPITCDCSVLPLQTYLKTVQSTYPQYKQFLDIKCDSPVFFKGLNVLSSKVQSMTLVCAQKMLLP